MHLWQKARRSRVDFNGVILTAAGALEAGDGGVVSRQHRKARRTLPPILALRCDECEEMMIPYQSAWASVTKYHRLGSF